MAPLPPSIWTTWSCIAVTWRTISTSGGHLSSLTHSRTHGESQQMQTRLGEATYLGYFLEHGQVHPLWVKSRPFRPIHCCNQERFLGLAGYYCHFVPNFSLILAPLTELLKDNPDEFAGQQTALEPSRHLWTSCANNPCCSALTSLRSSSFKLMPQKCLWEQSSPEKSRENSTP